jgi:YVTN family beta-propeller protein
MGRALIVVVMVAGGLVTVVGAGQQDRVCIDDLTCLDGDRIIVLERPLVQTQSQERLRLDQELTSIGDKAAGDGYAVCSYSDDAYPFDLTSHVVGAAIDLPGSVNYPYDATMRPDGVEVWVADASDNSVLVIDMASDTVAHQVAVGDYPVSVAFAKDESFAVAVCRDDTTLIDNIYLISTATHTVTSSWVGPKDGMGPGNIALDPVNGLFYMVEWYGGYLYELSADGTTVLRSQDLGSSLWQLVVDPDGSHVYVTDRSTDQVRVIDRTTLTQTSAVAVGDDPWGIDITPDGAKLYVACEDSHNVYAVDTSTWATTVISLGAGDPVDVDISPDGSEAFIAGGDSGSLDYVYVIDVATDTLSASIPFPSAASKVNVVATTAQTVPVELMHFTVE